MHDAFAQTGSEEGLAHLDEARDALLEAARPLAAFDGWNRATLARAEADAGLPAGTAELVCPAGVVDLLDYWGLKSDRAAVEALAATDLAVLRIRDRVRAGVTARLEAVGPERREAARRAAARLALPDAAARATRITWRAADAIWRALGDPSTDFNFYSKRAILSGVFASTFAVWLEGDDDRAQAFLDDRIENVMQFEKAKAGARDLAAKLPDPARVLARLRYGR